MIILLLAEAFHIQTFDYYVIVSNQLNFPINAKGSSVFCFSEETVYLCRTHLNRSNVV